MPEQNSETDPTAASPADLGATYAALLEGQVWQVDVPESTEGQLSDLPVAKEGARPPQDRDASPIPLLRIVEALLFVGGGPLTTQQACAIVRGLTPTEFGRTVDTLNRAYRVQGRPYRIRSTDNGHELVLRPKYLSLVEKMHGTTREARLSSAALDVLALVAYRQPVTKQDIESMRGVESGSVLRQLVRRGLLTVVHREAEGKVESVYRTTRRFIELFQLRGLEDLPLTEDLQRL